MNDGQMTGWMMDGQTDICQKQASILTHATMKKQFQNAFQCILSKSNTCSKLDIWKEEISECTKGREFLLMDGVNASQVEVTKVSANFYLGVISGTLCSLKLTKGLAS